MLLQSSKYTLLLGSSPPRVMCIDTVTRLVDCYASYFGALTCVAWSPDGRYILVSNFSTRFIATH